MTGLQKHRLLPPLLLRQQVLLRHGAVKKGLNGSAACCWNQQMGYRFCGTRGGNISCMDSVLGSHGILRTRRWVSVESNRYLQEKDGYVASVCEVGEALASTDPQDKHLLKGMETRLRTFHSDALVALIEYLAICHPRCLYRYEQKKKSGSSGNIHNDGGSIIEASCLCDALLSALAGRSVELSSKHVAFIGAICSASGIMDSQSFSLILYLCRQSIRRTQALQTLRALCLMQSDAEDTLAHGSRTCGTRLWSSALSSVLVRCMELETMHEGYDTQRLFCRALMRYFAKLHPDVRIACLWRLRKGAIRKCGDEKKGSSDETFLLQAIDGTLGSGQSPLKAFAAMEAASRSLSLQNVDTAYLRALVKGKPMVCCGTRMPSSPTTTSAVGDVTLLRQELLVMGQSHGDSKLQALATFSHRVLQISQLHILVNLADSVVRQCPSLCHVMAHRILQLAFSEKEDKVSISVESGASPPSVLTALHRLLPYADVLDLLESATVYGSHVGTAAWESPCQNVSVVQTISLVKCVAMHIPAESVPHLFRRIHRQRELAAFRLPIFILRVLLQALEYMTSESLSPEDMEDMHSFVHQERRRAVPPHRLVREEREGEALDGTALLADIEKRAALRLRGTGNSASSLLLFPSRLSRPGTTAATATTTTTTTTTAAAFGCVAVTTVALVAMFGPRAVKLVSPEAAVRDHVALSWLYAIYRMSVSVVCELEALAALAACQGVQLRISHRQRILVELSESVNEQLPCTDSTDPGESAFCRCVKRWLLGGVNGDFALKQLLIMADSDELAASLVSYIALIRQDTAAMREIQNRSWSSAAVFHRVGRTSGVLAYQMPARCCDAGKAFIGPGARENAAAAEGCVPVDDVIATSTRAIQFAKQVQWSDTVSATVDAACLWAYGDLLVLEMDTSRKLQYYEKILEVCQGDSHTGFLQHLPATIHSDVFAWAGGRGLWLQGLSLLHLAEGASREFRLPVDAYREVMRACLMYRIPTPAFLREKIRGSDIF